MLSLTAVEQKLNVELSELEQGSEALVGPDLQLPRRYVGTRI